MIAILLLIIACCLLFGAKETRGCLSVLMWGFLILCIIGFIASQKGVIMLSDNMSNEQMFQEYLDKYCKSYNCTREEALTHATVQEVRKDYMEKTGINHKLIVTLDCGCQI